MQLAPADLLATRVSRLRARIDAAGLHGLVITSLPNIAYLTGFFGSSAMVLVSRDAVMLLSDGRYAAVLDERARAFAELISSVVPVGSSIEQGIAAELRRFAGLEIGFEAANMTVRQHRFLEQQAAGGDFPRLTDSDGLVEQLRIVKDLWEVGRIREGAGRLVEVGKCILPKVLAGTTEAEIAADIDFQLRRAGFERPAFDTIVASGPRAALPHARATERRLEAGELVIVDFGGVLDGYCTDISRTMIVGESGPKERELLTRVTEAQQSAFEAVRPGGRPEDVDAAARERLARYGLADAFMHGTGHGLGLEVHEAPRVSRPRAGDPEPKLEPGMIMTLEPGAYIPGWGGVRIEDDVLVTSDGAEWLTKD